MNGIKWIFFDIGSTLVDESLVYEKRFCKIAESANVSKKYVYQKALEYYRSNKNGDLEVINLLGIEKPKWEAQYEALYDDVEACLKSLKSKYKIGVIANQDFGTEKRLTDFGIRQYFDVIVASAEEGAAKPDPRIFEIALGKAGCRADEAVMVGDRLDNDVVPANKIGMITVWIKQGFGKYAVPGSAEEYPDYTVDNLSEIAELF